MRKGTRSLRCNVAIRRLPTVQETFPWRGISVRPCSAAPLRCSSTSVQGADRLEPAFRVGSWNQHRVGSFLQRDCPWVSRLKAQGAARGELEQLLSSLRVEYAITGLHAWLAKCDLVAVQELDVALRCVLRAMPSRTACDGAESVKLFESAAHIDGRGSVVDSTVGLLLLPGSGLRVLREEHAELRTPLASGRGYAVRDHVGLLLHRCEPASSGRSLQSPGSLLAACSVHLHAPPGTSAESYLAYLAPLKDMMLRLHAADNSGAAGLVMVGDFNVRPARFQELTAGDAFWESMVPITPGNIGEPTAHPSNPCSTGDFMLARRQGLDEATFTWRCQADGTADFHEFEKFGDELEADAVARLPHLRAYNCATHAAESLGNALNILHGMRVPAAPNLAFRSVHAAPRLASPVPPPPPGGCPNDSQLLRPPPPSHLPAPDTGDGLRDVAEQLTCLQSTHRELVERCGDMEAHWRGTAGPSRDGRKILWKGLFTSDHRPLYFDSKSSN